MDTVLVICEELQRVPIREALCHDSCANIRIDTLEEITQHGIGRYIEEQIDAICSRQSRISACVGTHDIPSYIAAIINTKAGLPGPREIDVFECQNKYASRQRQQRIVPQCVPRFALGSAILSGDETLPYPMFVKPVVSTVSQSSFTINSHEELAQVCEQSCHGIAKQNKIYKDVIKHGTIEHHAMNLHDELLCEELLQGEQITVDGFAFQGTVTTFGVTKSVFLPNTLSFTRFDYPHFFADLFHKEIETITKQFVIGMGLDNTLFNIEYIVDETSGQIGIVEINTRLSFQFVYLIKQVTGYDPLEAMYSVAIGKKPNFQQFKQDGKYALCSSCVLRTHEDKIVTRVPTPEMVALLRNKYGDFNFTMLAKQGSRLSDYRQDTDSYRIAFVDIPGKNLSDIQRKLKDITVDLDIGLE